MQCKLIPKRLSAKQSLTPNQWQDGRGRDIEEVEDAIKFDKSTCIWQVLGNAGDVFQSDERKEIMEFLSSSMKPMTPSDVAKALSKNSVAIRQCLSRMAKAGDVVKVTRGKYTICHNGHNVTFKKIFEEESHFSDDMNVTGNSDRLEGVTYHRDNVTDVTGGIT